MSTRRRGSRYSPESPPRPSLLKGIIEWGVVSATIQQEAEVQRHRSAASFKR